jgi:hypothetical protein
MIAIVTGPLALAAGAEAGALRSVEHGAVDFGDRVAYRIDGPSCEAASARIVVTAAGNDVLGEVSQPRVDGVDPSGCTGAASVPSFVDVRAAGWRQGDPIEISLASSDGETVPLRYARIEADGGTAVAGAPTVVDAADPDTGPWDKAMSMSQGDAVGIGRVDLGRVEAFSLRICLPIGVHQSVFDPIFEERYETPTYMSIHQGSASGPAIVQTIDVASHLFTDDRLNTHGFGRGCWHLVTLPVTGTTVGNAPELFVVFDAGAGNVLLNSVDVDGTGARVAAPRQQDPSGTKTIFDGTSFDGWTQTNCVLDQGAARSADGSIPGSGCRMRLDRAVHDVILRFDLRRQNFFDNGAIYVPNEVQLRSAGEYGPGGYFGEYAARWEKFNTWPDWSQIEIVQLGGRYVVTLNGRTVTDHVASAGDPDPYQIQLVNQPEWAWQYRVRGGFGDMQPGVQMPTDWGRFWYRNIRLYECQSATDPVCVAAADARLGQAPRQ